MSFPNFQLWYLSFTTWEIMSSLISLTENLNDLFFSFVKVTTDCGKMSFPRGKTCVSLVCRGRMINIDTQFSSTATNMCSICSHIAAVCPADRDVLLTLICILKKQLKQNRSTHEILSKTFSCINSKKPTLLVISIIKLN